MFPRQGQGLHTRWRLNPVRRPRSDEFAVQDAAYDSIEIGLNAWLSGHVAITDVNTRRDTQLKKDRAREA